MSALFSSPDHAGSSTSKIDAPLLGAACWIPLLTFLALFGFAAIAWARVGHWPYCANPDPKDLNLPFLHGAALFSLPIGFVSIPACLLMVIAAWSSLKRRDVVAYTLGAAAWAFILPITGHLFEWLID